ncbi:MAG: 2-oxo acid dehydrogenase subunit E2 [Actinomycetia bacterium]|nr:2-oxo acid dehydrogenase subunit E2 [Actinomycetes bacterium]
MSLFEMRLPDVGEGVAEAELVEWMVAVGDEVTPDTVLAEVLTDKASVEVAAPVRGFVANLHGEPGEILAVGGPLIDIETDADASEAEVEAEVEVEVLCDTAWPEQLSVDPVAAEEPATAVPVRPTERVTAAPAVRARAKEMGIDISTVPGTGAEGHVTHEDLDRVGGASGPSPTSADARVVAVRGVRRQIAKRMAEAWADIPHITYVEEVDVTQLERTRAELNRAAVEGGARLTVLPFLVRAMVIAIRDQPELNAHYDHAAETLTVFDGVHVGIATQTDDGLRVPVVRNCESFGMREIAAEIARVSKAARQGSATRHELTGSTITITSLGVMGGIVTTPIINAPEVAIVGVNKIATRPVWMDSAFVPRQVLNLSSSFDHRMVDGWDAATFIQRVKTLLETPALLFDH